MFSVSLLVLACPSILTLQTPFNGLLNGDFQRVLEEGFLNKSPSTPVDGAFWVGAEGLTQADQGQRFLVLAAPQVVEDVNHLAYQRVGVPADTAASAVLSGKVTVPSGGEARVTLSEPDSEGLYWMLPWVLLGSGNFYMNDPEKTATTPDPWWECWEVDPVEWGDTDPHSLEWQHSAATSLFTSDETVNQVDWVKATLRTPGDPSLGQNAGYLELRWPAPKDGWVRVILRPYTLHDPSATPTESVEHQILRHDDVGDELIRSDEIVFQDNNGSIIVERLWVDAGHTIKLRAYRQWDGQAQVGEPNAQFKWAPAIVYEGRAITYRFGDDLDPLGTINTEHFIELQANPGVQTTFSRDFGVDFADAFNDEEPRAPLDVMLAAHSGTVAFDDIACMVDFPSVDEAGLRAAILDEASWARGIRLLPGTAEPCGNLDRDEHGLKRGSKATPYEAHHIDIQDGPILCGQGSQYPACINTGRGDPFGLWDMLLRAYSSLEYEDFFAIREQQLANERSDADLIYILYDVLGDNFPTNIYEDGVYLHEPIDVVEEGSVGIGIHPALLDYYYRTNDPIYLEAAFTYAKMASDNGLVNADSSLGSYSKNRIDMISGAPFDIETGVNLLRDPGTGVLDADLIWGDDDPEDPFSGAHFHLTPTSFIVQTYAACKKFNDSDPSYSGHFPTTDLVDMRDNCYASLVAAAEVVNPNFVAVSQGASGWFTGSFQAYHGEFNDLFGYQAQDARLGYLAIETMPNSDSVDDAIHDILQSHWVVDGADFFYPLWLQGTARYEVSAGDGPRAWPVFVQIVLDDLVSSADIDKYKAQLRDAALNALKYQYADGDVSGVWTGGALERFQLLNLSGGFGGGAGPAANYPWALSLAYLVSDSQQDKDYLMSGILAMLESNQAHFKAPYGYWHSLFGRAAPKAGVEWRALTKFVECLDNIVAPAPTIPLASPSIEPASYLQTEATQYKFRLTWPSTVSQATMDEVLEDRMKITVWAYDAGDEAWERSYLVYPDDFDDQGPDYQLTLKYVEITTDEELPAPPDSGWPIKYDIITWEVDEIEQPGRWNRDTSVQRVPPE